VELDLFTILASEPLSAEQITGRLKSEARATTILLDALTAMRLLVKPDGLYSTSPEAASLLTDDSPESMLPGMRHTAHLWRSWSQLTDIVLNGGPAERSEDNKEDRTKAFIGAMHVGARRNAEQTVTDIGAGDARALIDVGGASGSYTVAFLKAVPGMRATIFDLPDVVPMAHDRMKEEGLTDRVTIVGGNYNHDPLPGEHDLALLSSIIHQNSHKQNVVLFSKVHDALVPGGRIIVRDFVMNADRTEPAAGALFAVNMLVNTDGGNSYTFEEIESGLTEAGFDRIRLIKEGDGGSLVEAFRG
jgi:precorrin-6B methylase 2